MFTPIRVARESRARGHARERGFTLVETLVMLAIVAMAALVAIPNLQRIKVKTQTTQALVSAAGAFDLARSEALRRHSPVAVAYDTTTRVLTIWEDWDPDNQDVAENNDGVRNGNEDIIEVRHLASELSVSGPPAGDSTPMAALTVTVYGSDGSLDAPDGGGAAYLIDQPGNQFRIRVNGATGSSRVEQWTEAATWDARKEKWSWKY